MSFDPEAIRRQFPILASGDLIYLDSAATSQKPQAVLDAMNRYYEEQNANVHRGMHVLAERATVAYEDARKTVASFIGAHPFEVIFTKSCTEAVNLVARSWGEASLKEGDAVVLSILEHHSNIVPWLQLQEKIGITVEWIDIDEDGQLKLDDLDRFLAKGNVKLVSITGMSNVLGTVIPLKEIINRAHAAGAKVLVDAAQLVVHHPIDVQDLDCDFLAFSAHKIYGPTGIGILYGKRELLESMPPYLGGGMMIGTVTAGLSSNSERAGLIPANESGFTSAEIPAKFEAGTPPIAEAVGLQAALDWLLQYNWNDIQNHEEELMYIAIEQLNTIEDLTILSHPQPPTPNPQSPSGCVSFTINGVHPHDLTHIIGNPSSPRPTPNALIPICLRAGHHCTQPLHNRLGINASTRMSFGIYNTKDDIEKAIEAIQNAISILV